MTEAPFIGIERHRLQTDGEGVTTLVGFYGCPLRCRYCINAHHLNRSVNLLLLSPAQLYKRVKIDELYYLTTGGGITFGGGEPGLYPDFITEFRRIVGPEWKICLETSLNFEEGNLRRLLPVVDSFIIDIKDLDEDVYYRYTECEITPLLRNLNLLVCEGRQTDCHIRIPLIPEFNTPENTERSKDKLEEMGFENVEVFPYLKR